jgi:hypothetical protein
MQRFSETERGLKPATTYDATLCAKPLAAHKRLRPSETTVSNLSQRTEPIHWGFDDPAETDVADTPGQTG